MPRRKGYLKVKPKGKRSKRLERAKKIQALARDMRNNGGQPTTYDPAFAKMAAKLCQLGATDNDLAEHFSVTTTTIWNWSTRHQEFFKAIHENKSAYDQRVERALAQRAIGYTYDSERLFYDKEAGEVIRAPIKEHVPPSEKAAIMWLTNRDSNNWKNRNDNTFDPDKPLKIIVEGGLPRDK